MTIDILIATLNDGIENISDIFLEPQDSLTYKVSHQITNDKDYRQIYKKYANRQDVKIVVHYTKGLSKNRNYLLEISNADIGVIMDDDIKLIPNIYEVLFNAFISNPQADIITFQTSQTNNTYNRDKKYSPIPYKHTLKSIASVSSIEIAFKVDTIRQHNLYFDERFGLGSIYPMGEEFIWLSDAYNKKLFLAYEPQIISFHNTQSSGFSLQKEVLIARGAVYFRVFGWKANLLYIYSMLKHYPRYKHIYKPWSYFMLLYRGAKIFKHEESLSA